MAEMKSSSLWGGIAVFLIVFGVCAGTALALSGSGTEEDPWLIQSLADFDEFASDANYWDDYTRLETDVNLAGRVYEKAVIAPDVNDDESWFQGTPFTGVFDGNDHKVANLSINDGGIGNEFLGLFGSIRYGAIRNLGLEGGSVSGTGYYVGGLIGNNREGSVSNCYSTGDVTGIQDVGGLVGRNRHHGIITDSYSASSVTGNSDVGGLVGENDWSGTIRNCYATGRVAGDSVVGGLVAGNYDGVITNCYSTGSVSGDSVIGGLVGGNGSNGTITNCYSTGSVSGDSVVGGLAGINWSGTIGTITNCYSTGRVDGIGDNIGGLVGQNGVWGEVCHGGVITDSYWDIEASGEPNMCGGEGGCCGGYGCDNSYGKTTAEMHQQSTFTNWDFINVWNIGENQTYPYLRTVPAGDINKDKTVNFLDVCIIAEQWCNEG